MLTFHIIHESDLISCCTVDQESHRGKQESAASMALVSTQTCRCYVVFLSHATDLEKRTKMQINESSIRLLVYFMKENICLMLQPKETPRA